jgi:hypothetical protein
MSLPVIIDANSPTPTNHVKLYITCADQYRYGDKVVLIDLSHDFQVMGHLHDVLAQSLGGLVKARDVKLSIPGESSPISAADLISDVIDRITPVDGLHHLTMVVEEWSPRVYSSNPFEMRKEWDMYRPIYKTSDSSDSW